MKMRYFALIASLWLGLSGLASAATLDFSGVQNFSGNPLVLANATITDLSGGNVLVGPNAIGQKDGFCFLSIGGNSGCQASGEIAFSNAVSSLMFDVVGAQFGDSVTISAFNGATLLGSIVATVDGLKDFSAFGAITRLSFDDNSTNGGVGYATFAFDATPLPGTLPLFATGLGALGLLGWRRKRKAQAVA